MAVAVAVTVAVDARGRWSYQVAAHARRRMGEQWRQQGNRGRSAQYTQEAAVKAGGGDMCEARVGGAMRCNAVQCCCAMCDGVTAADVPACQASCAGKWARDRRTSRGLAQGEPAAALLSPCSTAR